jgi:hypothetical protein
VLRVCEGSTACSADSQLGFADFGCGFCPLVEFTCPDSGVFSALAGSFPDFSFDEETEEFTEIPGPPSACRPKLVTLSDADNDAGIVSFDEVHPVLVTNCGRCHAEETGLGTLLDLPPFASTDIEVAFEAVEFVGSAILAQINAGVMPPDTCGRTPPGSPGCVSVDDFNLIRAWFAGGRTR